MEKVDVIRYSLLMKNKYQRLFTIDIIWHI